MTLKTKFLLPATLLIIAGMSITTWLTYQRSTESLAAGAVDKAKSTVNGLQAAIELWVGGAQNEIITLSMTDEVFEPLGEGAVDPKLKERALALLMDSVSRHSMLDSILFIDAKGIVVGSTAPEKVGANYGEREYFQQAMAGKNFVSSPIFPAEGGPPVFVISAPIRSGGKIVGVISSGVKIASFTSEFVTPLDTPASYAFILAPDGDVLAHPNGKLVGKANLIKDEAYGREVAQNQRGAIDAVSLGIEKLIVFEKSKNLGWIVGMAINKDAAFADARSLGFLILLLSAGLVVILAAGIWLILSINVLRPIGALVVSAERIAEGDLDGVLESDRRDEIGVLQAAMAKMVGNLEEKITEADEKGRIAEQEAEKASAAMEEAEEARLRAERAREEGMLHAAGQLESIVEAVTNAMEAISGQVEQSSQGSRRQSERMTETATAMEEMSATVLEVAKSAETAAETADSARKNAGEGSQIVSKVIASVGEAQAKALDLKQDMAQLGEQVQGIGQIMNVISDIADQTNLLALNAAIEAARAGEAGRGFAVVADEVRKLAEKTMTATKEVGDAIAGIQKGTSKNVENVDQAVRRIDEATELAERSGRALSAIVTLVDQSTDQARSIATASEEQSAATEEINRSIMDVTRISSETADALDQSTNALLGLADQTRILRGIIDDMQAGGDGGLNSRKKIPA